MSVRKYILIILLLNFPICLTNNDILIYGIVQDETGQPISNAEVDFNSLKTTSDVTGYYAILDTQNDFFYICRVISPNTKFRISVYRAGYYEFHDEISLKNDSNNKYNIILRKI